jgi:hypothetical protein
MTKPKEGNPGRGGRRPFNPPRPRNCRQCGTEFPALYGKHFYCSKFCYGRKKRSTLHNYWKPLEKFGHSAFMGNTCELFVQYGFSREGWHVFNSTGAYAPFDIIVFRNGILRTVEIRKGKITKAGHKVQFNRGNTDARPVFKQGTQWVAIVVLEQQEMFIFEVVKQTSFFSTSSAIDIRQSNHPEGKGEEE